MFNKIKTRIIVNKNGFYKVQYKTFLFWKNSRHLLTKSLEEAREIEKSIIEDIEYIKNCNKWRVV